MAAEQDRIGRQRCCGSVAIPNTAVANEAPTAAAIYCNYKKGSVMWGRIGSEDSDCAKYKSTSHSRIVFLLTLPAVFLVILPILAAHHLPLLDAPGHEARLAALWDLLITGRGSSFYDINTFFLPGVGFDFIGLALISVVEPETAGRIFFALTLVLTLCGVLTLNRRVTGRWSIVPLAASLLSYNLIAILGFFSYAFGLAMLPWALALRLSLERKAIWCHLVGAALGIGLLFCHVFDFGAYAAMNAGFILDGLLSRRLRLSGAALCAMEQLPALGLFFLMSTSQAGGPTFAANPVQAKLFGLLKAMTSGSMIGDAAFVLAALALLALLLFCARTRIVRPFVPGLGLLIVLYLLLPEKIASGDYVDARMPIVIGLMLLSGLDVRLRPSWPAKCLVAIVVAAFVVKQGALTVLWRSFDPFIDQFAAMLDRLPSGAVIMQQECEPDATDILGVYRERQPSMTHLSAMASFSNSRFVANTWAIPSQQTFKVRPNYQPYYNLQGNFGNSNCVTARYVSELDEIEKLLKARQALGIAVPPTYFLLIRPPESQTLAHHAQLLAENAQYELYQVSTK